MSQLLHLCPFLFSFAALFHDLPEVNSPANTALKSHKLPVTWNDPLSSPPLEHAVWALVIPTSLALAAYSVFLALVASVLLFPSCFIASPCLSCRLSLGPRPGEGGELAFVLTP